MIQKPSKEKWIVSFGLDMTLLGHKTWKIPNNAVKTLELPRKDSAITVGSGRNMDHDMSAVYRDMVIPDTMIHMNGIRVVVEGNTLLEHLANKERLRALLEYGDVHGISLGVSQEGKDYHIHPESVVHMDRLCWGVSEHNFMGGWELLDMSMRILVYTGGLEGARELETHSPGFKFPVFSGNMGVDVVGREASKAKELKRLYQYYDIGLEQTMAFGDNMNDYETIREADIGIAMGNSVEEPKVVADCMADDIDRGGVWEAYRHLGLI